MRELSKNEIDTVAGSGLGADIAMVAATGWASTVAGTATGAVVGGPVGAVVGAAAGLFVGVGSGIAYTLARSGSGGNSNNVEELKWQKAD